jgi:tetratricopeptide (TPR) repeat protein
MRILFLCNQWAIMREPARLVGNHPELPGTRERVSRHQWFRAVGGSAVTSTDIPYDVRRDSVRAIAGRCPGGPPDVMIVWAPGYVGLPAGMEEAPFPIVACFSDWPLVMPGQAGLLDVYDYLFTDRGGVRTFQQMGLENVEYWPMYAHDPDLSRVIPGVEKAWDIGLVGNLSPVVQRDRAPWLARVARLADRYRVRIAGGVFNEDYTHLMNATKITFNYTFKVPLNGTLLGALNMRCYEAAACGSLLFCEEDNEEIREIFEDRVHGVLYNEQNLEELIDYYLTHDDERERIAAAAVERVAEFSFPRNLNRLADRLEALALGVRPSPRGARPLSAAARGKSRARQMAGTYTLGAAEAAAACLRETVAAAPGDAAAHNDLAVINCGLMGEDAEHNNQLLANSLQHLRRAVELAPDCAHTRLNLAHLYAATGWPEAAMEMVQIALQLLESGKDTPADLFALPFPYSWDEFRVQSSILYAATRSTPESFSLLRRCLLLYRGGLLLGKLSEAQGLPALAAVGYRIAVATRPDLGAGHVALARVLAQGEQPAGPLDPNRIDEALAHLEAGLRTDPFITEAWTLYADLLRARGLEAEARRFLTERLVMLEALSPARERLVMRDALCEMEEVCEALTRRLEPRTIAA